MNEEELKKLKEKYGTIFQIEVGDKIVFLKRPTRQILSLAATKGKRVPFAVTEVIVTNCKVAGDDIDLNDPGVLLGLSAQMELLLEEATVSIKKL